MNPATRLRGHLLFAALPLTILAAALPAQQTVSSTTPLLDGASVVLLDSATIAASPARTLADLLAGRVAGLNVTYPSGAPGMAPELTMRGTATVYGPGRPTLIVDGVIMREDRHLLGPALDRQRPSHVWALPTAEIAEVRVLPGPAAGTMLPFGAPRGAILVRTKRGGRGQWSSSSFVEMTSQAALTPFSPRTITAGDLTAGGNTAWCPRTDVATGYCTQTTTATLAPFGGRSPFTSGVSTRAGLSAAGDVRVATLRIGGVFDQSPDLTAYDSFERLDLSLAAESREWRGLSASLNGRYARSGGDYVHWTEGGVMELGTNLVQPGDASFSPLYRHVDSLLARAHPYRTDRTTAALGLRYAPTAWLSAWADVNTERAIRGVDRTRPIYFSDSAGQPFANGTSREVFNLTQGTGSASIGLRASRRLRRGLKLTGEAGGHVVNLDMNEIDFEYREDTSGASSYDAQGLTPDIRSRSFFAALRLDVGDRGWIGGGYRKEATRLLGATYGDDPFNTMQAVWHLSRERFMPRLHGLDSLSLSASYGESGDHESVLGAFVQSGGFVGGGGVLPARLQRTLEREATLDASLAGGRMKLRGSAFTRALRDGYVFTNAQPPASPYTLQSWVTHGHEWTLTLPALGTGPVRWDAAITWSSARTRLTHSPTTLASMSTLVGGSRVRWEEGLPFGTLWAYGYTFDDANDDGIIDATEITLTPEAARGVTQPRDLLAATLTAGWRRLSAGVTLDGKFGHVRYDGNARLACQFLVCKDLYDANATLAEQARAVASGYTGSFTGPLDPGEFVRARELWLRLALPDRAVGRLAGRAALTLALRNAVLWTRYPSGDPEVGSFAFGSVQRGDYLVPGLGRQFSLRLDLAP